MLVVAGLHVGAFTAFLFWIARKLKLAPSWTARVSLTLICGYVGAVEERPPVLRAALMTGISAGENNPYGHPSPELLARLQSAGTKILRTDRDGAVHILTDGSSLEIRCFETCIDAAGGLNSARSQPPNREQYPK